jgi:hypothetical protein
MAQLGTHDIPAADQLPQGSLAEDRPELEWVVITGKHVLLGEAGLDELVVLRPVLLDQASRGDSPRVVLV